MKKVLPVTVVIPVKNEECNLAKCISRLHRFAEIVVVDSGSTDRTLDIAREYGARTIQFDWNGEFPKKRNWYLLNHTPANEWVLFLDADEFVTDEFCHELEQAIAEGCHDGFWLNYTTHFTGHPLRHGDPQRKLATFKFGKGLYERVDEVAWSGLDMEVHEHPLIDGSVGEIFARIDHDDDRGIAKFLDRHREYALWEARRYHRLCAAGPEAWMQLTDRQRMKYRNIDKWWFAPVYFIATYVLRCGFLDGSPGLQFAFCKLWYFNSIRLLIQEERVKTALSEAMIS
jgi:glycosyltransferase involved in cell wall biosynthesis